MSPTDDKWHHLPAHLALFNQITTQFIDTIAQRTVAHQALMQHTLTLSNEGINIDVISQQLQEHIIPQLSASRGPRYWGFVTGGATPIATLADWLVSTFDQNVSKDGDSIASDIERQTLSWLCELFHLPDTFKGSLTTGATAANVLAAVTARQYLGEKQHINVAKDGLFGLDIDIFSTTPHASMIKSLGLAGIGQKQRIQINNVPDSEQIDCDALEQALQQSQAKGKWVIASAATVTATDFDDLITISALCRQYDAWLHVDAAFGIFERLIHGPKGKTQGLELADSITLDAHKWLNVPYESGIFLTRHQQSLFESCDVSAPYLTGQAGNPAFMSLGIENSRRFRAFPIWLSLLAYGKDGIAAWVKNNIHCAAKLANWIADSQYYELMHPCQLNVVLFKPITTD